MKIEYLNVNEPNQFWSYIKRLGPEKHKDIPWEVELPDGGTTHDRDVVLEQWKNDFEKLYSVGDNNFDKI